MKKTDISYKNEEVNIKFNFRVALICNNDEATLLQKEDNGKFWGLIGGRVSLGETTLDAIIRETKEETGVKLLKKDVILIKILENFFTYKETKFHELLYIYKVENNKNLNGMNDFKTLDKDNVLNKWIPFSKLSEIEIRPEIVKSCYNDNTLTHDIIK